MSVQQRLRTRESYGSYRMIVTYMPVEGTSLIITRCVLIKRARHSIL
jgi:hypothetical protein